MINKIIFNIIIRYTLLLSVMIVVLSNYFVEIISLFLVNILGLIFSYLSPQIIGNSIYFAERITFIVVEECIAPSAYLLIAMIFLTLPLDIKKVGKLIGLSYMYFTLFNLLRMILLILIYFLFGVYYFDALHLIFYQIVSGIVTALIVIYLFEKRENKKTLSCLE